MTSQYLLGFTAGGLSLLAPCVLPLLPLIVSNSLRQSKWGPILNALGLTFSFTLFGILSGIFAQIFNPEIIRKVGAVILILAGLSFILPKLKNFLQEKLQFVTHSASKLQGRINLKSAFTEFFEGSLLGMIWTPCSGPTLAFAVGLATQSEQLWHASLIFFFFGLGAGLGLISIGLLIKKFQKLRVFLLGAGNFVNVFAGLLSIAIGALILTGLEGHFEEWLLGFMPDWLISLSVRY